MHNLDPQTARLLFWIVLGITIAASLSLAIFKFRENIRLWFPILLISKMKGVVTARFEWRQKPSIAIPRRSMKNEPDSFIFPYLRNIANPLTKEGKEVLPIRFYCPSALPYDLKLHDVSVKLTVGGVTIRHGLEDDREIEIIGLASNDNTLDIPLSIDDSALISGYIEQSKPVDTHLELTGLDKKSKRHKLSTETWTTTIQK